MNEMNCYSKAQSQIPQISISQYQMILPNLASKSRIPNSALPSAWKMLEKTPFGFGFVFLKKQPPFSTVKANAASILNQNLNMEDLHLSSREEVSFKKQKLQNRSRFYIVGTLFSFLSFPLSPLPRPSNMEKKIKSLTLNDRRGKESPPQISPPRSGEGLAP